MVGSETWTRTQAKREAAKFSADYAADRLVFDETPRSKAKALVAGAAMTVRKLGEAWTSGELTKTYGNVNRLRVKAGAKIDEWCLKANAYEVRTRGPSGPAFGDLSVAAVTTDDAAKVMAAQPTEQRSETRVKQYNRLHRLFDLAIFPMRLRPDNSNPVVRYLRPSPDADKLFCFLYPSEVVALLRGKSREGETKVSLGRRVLYALAVYTGQRKGSLFALKWKHVDVDHGTLASFKTKTGAAQYFVADRGLMKVLEAWRLHRGEPGDDEPIITEALVEYEAKRLATALRDDMKAVGVTRAILFEDDADNVEPLRFHDLRSTFCTWARRDGKSNAWISERTGHQPTGDMINRYDRGAQTLADLEYGPFPDITRAIPELPPRLATTLATASAEPVWSEAETPAIPAAFLVGAIGFEPTTPTVSKADGGVTRRGGALRTEGKTRTWCYPDDPAVSLRHGPSGTPSGTPGRSNLGRTTGGLARRHFVGEMAHNREARGSRSRRNRRFLAPRHVGFERRTYGSGGPSFSRVARGKDGFERVRVPVVSRSSSRTAETTGFPWSAHGGPTGSEGAKLRAC
jgi:integrase